MLPLPSHWLVRPRRKRAAVITQCSSSTQSNNSALCTLFSVPQFTYCPDSRKTFTVEGYVGCRVFLLPPSSTPPLPHPHTHPSSHPPGTYLSVAFIHNPRDLNLFPPHRPRLFLFLLFPKNFMLSSLSSFFFFALFFFLFTLLLFLYLSFFFSAFYLFQSSQRFQHPYLQERKGGGEKRISIK